MRQDELIDIYMEVRDCTFKDELYSVRDNGAILRHAKKGQHKRRYDDCWTFGRKDKNGYMRFSNESVHRIVAVAYHSEPPTAQHVVDHIDTNRANNRPENLRWVTKLENALLNPITSKRIIQCCGSIEKFLENPSCIRQFADKNPSYEWMRSVTLEEATTCRENLQAWAKSDQNKERTGQIGDWIYLSKPKNVMPELGASAFHNAPTKSLTQNALQQDIVTPTEFLCCPQFSNTSCPMEEYNSALSIGKKFSQNKNCKTIIIEYEYSRASDAIFVLCKSTTESAVKPWFLTKITYENGNFIHHNNGSFFKEDGARKRYTLALGKEWNGGSTIDDYC